MLRLYAVRDSLDCASTMKTYGKIKSGKHSFPVLNWTMSIREAAFVNEEFRLNQVTGTAVVVGLTAKHARAKILNFLFFQKSHIGVIGKLIITNCPCYGYGGSILTDIEFSVTGMITVLNKHVTNKCVENWEKSGRIFK